MALVAIVVTSPAPATPGVFSLDRLRLGSVAGPENYLYTAGNSIYPEGGIDAGAFYYKVVVTDTAGTVRNPAFPCTPGANFTTANNSYNVSPSDPVSNSVYWKFTLQQFANSSCTGAPAKSAFLQFDVAKLTSWADPALTTQKSVFAPGSSVYVTAAGMKPTQSNVSNTWVLPSSAAACGNTVGGDRANIDGFGRLPSTVGGYLLYAPVGSSGPQWNRPTSYDGPCPAFGVANEGQWSLRINITPTVFVTLPAFTVDATPPPSPSIDSGPPNLSNSASAQFTFSDSEAGVSFGCRLDGGSYTACTSPKSYSGLAEGGHTFQVVASDAAGNQSSAASYGWTVDTTAPDTTIDSGPTGTVSSDNASFTFSSEAGAVFECELDGGGFGACTSPKAYSGLSEGLHTFRVRARDAAGNLDPSPAARTWTVDTTAPPVPSIDSGPPDPSGSPNASFSFSDTESGVSFRCRLDGGSFSACTSPKAYSGLGEGLHTFEVFALDGAGNESAGASHTWTIDVAPVVTLATPADGSSTNDSTPTFSGTAGTAFGDSATVTVKVYAGPAPSGTPVQTLDATRDSFGNWSIDASDPLATGTYTAQAEQSDLDGNVGLSSANTFSIDATPPPTPTIDSGPPNLSNSASAQFTFSDSEAGVSFGCRLDGGSYTACTSPKSYSGLAEGGHTFQVVASDAAGNQSSAASYGWTVDTTAPDTTIDSGPTGTVSSDNASFTFSSEAGAVFECELDGGGFGACTSPKAYSGLSEGLHTFRVRARDAAGNLDPSPAARTWTVDTTAPDTTIDSGPTGTVSSDNASFTFSSEAGAVFECELDGGGFGACTSPKAYSGLSEGLHTFRVRARDAAGNLDPSPAARTWTVDTTAPPVPSIDSGPPDPSGSPNASFSFSDTESGVSFRCRLDGGSFSACTSPKAYSGLGEGLHTFEVFALDGAGNESAGASHTWTIDVAPVVTLATPADGSSTNDSTPTFSGTAGIAFGDSATVTVKVYAGPAPSGTPVQTLDATRDSFGNWSIDASDPLATGTYTAQAEQSDLDGNVGLSSANTFDVTLNDITPPDITLSTPANGALTNDSTPTFSGTAGTAAGDLPTVTVNVYQGPTRTLVQSRSTIAGPGGAFSVDASPALGDGTYVAQADQSDVFGNTGHSADHTFTVDTTSPDTTIDSGPTGTVSSDNASFTFSSEAGAVFECELDGGGFGACTSPKAYSGLSEGLHTFRVRARDAAGNLDPSPAARTWTVDTTAPPVPSIDSGPPDPSGSPNASFSFSDTESGVSFRCRLDGGSFSACTSPKAYSGLGEGLHTFEVFALDGAGNSSGVAFDTWAVDTTAPVITLSSPVNGSTTGDATPPFTGTAGTAAGDATTVTVKIYVGPSPTGTPIQTLTTTRGTGGAYSVEPSQPLTKGTFTAQAEQTDGAEHTGSSSPTTFTVSSPAYRREVLADNPRVYYRLGELVGTTAADETGVNPGMYVNGVTLGQAGGLGTSVNTAATFDGINDYVTAPNSSSLNITTAVTVEAWAKRTRSGVWQVVVSKPGDGASKNENYSIWFNSLDKPVAFFGNGTTFARVDGPVLDSNWHYLAATYDNATARIYVDGTLRASTSSTVSLTANSLPLNIGRSNGNAFFYTGSIDEVAVYGTALSSARILAHYAAATTFDAAAPVVTLTAPANGLRTDDTTPTFSGTAGTAGGDSSTVTVKVYAGTTPTGTPLRVLTTVAGAGGAYSVDASPALPEGTYTARTEQADDIGNVGLSSANTFQITFGDVTPPVVTLTSPPNGGNTTDRTPAFSGVGGTAPGDLATVVVKVYAGTSATGTPVETLSTTRDGTTGAYTVDASPALDAAMYTARAEQSDSASNVGQSATTTFTIPSEYRAAVMADNPRAYWRLGEQTGTTAVDQVGVNHGTYSNVALGSTGPLTGDDDSAASFDGTTAYATAPDSNSLDLSSGATIEAWVKRTKSSVWQIAVGKGGDGQSKNENYSLWISPFDKAVSFFGNGTTAVRVESAAALDTEWHYVVSTYNNATAKIYIDGALQASISSTVQLTPNSLPINFGRINAGGSYYGGFVDEVAIYGTVLTASQIGAHYDAANLYDTTPPVVTLTTPEQGSSTKNTRPAFAGMAAVTSRDSDTVTLRLYSGSTPTGPPLQTLSASRFPTGVWRVSAASPLPDGTYTAQAEQVDSSNNVGLSAPQTFTVQTNPPPSSDPVMVGAGDIGDCETQSDENVGLLLNSFPSAVVYTIGDNAYPNGTLEQFNNCLHPAWGHAKARIRPALGGHDLQTANAGGYMTYFAQQLVPFGPTASDWTKAYYSYDLGTWHVLVFNTECVGYTACSVPDQITWARADLDAHPAACTLAILPNPRFSSGDEHGNNASIQPFWDLLNEKGVEVAVSADDHIYERFAPQNAQGAYSPTGVREFLSGTGGSSHYGIGIVRANSELENHATFGLLKFTLHNGSYEWEFVPEAGFSFTDSGTGVCH